MQLFWTITIAVTAIIALTIIYLAIGCTVTRFVSKRRPELFERNNEFFVLLAIIVVLVWPICLVTMLIAWLVQPANEAKNKEA